MEKVVRYETKTYVNRSHIIGIATVYFWVFGSEEVKESVVERIREEYGERFEVYENNVRIVSNSIAGAALREFAKSIEKEIRKIIREEAKKLGFKTKAM